VANVLAAFRQSITGLDWMSAATRSQALDKLERLSAKVGAPGAWRSYGGLEIKPDDLIGNMRRAQQFENARRMAAMGLPADRTEWPVTPQTTNAFYKQVTNEIVLPAAILQPPFFNIEADDAVNYGSIGAIVGHEIGHAFDDRGRWLDGAGVVRNWWKPQDEQQFEARARALVAQVNAYKVSSAAIDIPAYGERTLGESLGDLGGLAIAYKAYHLSLAGRPSPVIDGFTGDQRFFIGWAQVWRAKVRPEYLRQWLLTSPHALAPYRANIPPSNMAAFYEAFGVKPSDNLYRDPDRRVRIW
jgi:predicted metalloendopeptidase